MLFVHVLIDRSFNFADRKAVTSKQTGSTICFSKKKMIKLVMRDLNDKTFVWLTGNSYLFLQTRLFPSFNKLNDLTELLVIVYGNMCVYENGI